MILQEKIDSLLDRLWCTASEIKEADKAVRTALVKSVLDLPPELAVQLPNIHRCLSDLAIARDALVLWRTMKPVERLILLSIHNADAQLDEYDGPRQRNDSELWIKEFFLPELERQGLVILKEDDPRLQHCPNCDGDHP